MNISLRNKVHNFQKINLTTLKDAHGHYDLYQCTKCKIEGKRYSLDEWIHLTKQYSTSRIEYCDGNIFISDQYLGELIRITDCNATWAKAEDLFPGTFRMIVSPPTGYINGDRGVWIPGKTEPLKILFDEFQLIKIKRNK